MRHGDSADVFVRRFAGSGQASFRSFVTAAVDAAGARGAVLARPSQDGDRLELVAAVGVPEEAVRRSRALPLDSDDALATAWRTQHPEFVDGGILGESDASAVALPLVAGDRPVGVLGLEFEHPLEAAAWEPLAQLTATAAAAFDGLERAILEDRSSRWQQLTALLSSLDRLDEIAQVIVAGACETAGAVTGTMSLLDADRTHLELAAAVGYPPELAAGFEPIPLTSRSPLTDAIETGEIVVVETSEEFDETYPDVRRRGAPAEQAVLAVPMLVESRPVGVLGLSFALPRLFSESEIAFFVALGHLGEHGFDRAERARRYDRLAALQAVTAELSRAPTPADVGRVVVKEAVRALGADMGRLVLADGEGGFRSVAQSGGYEDIIERLQQTGEFGAMPAAVAAATGEPVYIGSLTKGEFPVFEREFGALGFKAFAAVPLPDRRAPLGAVSFAWREERVFSDEDTGFLGAIAGVCAQALERARAHERSLRAEARLRHLLDHLDGAVLVVDDTLDVRYANEEAGRLFGQPELIGRRLPDRWPELRLPELVRVHTQENAAAETERVTVADGRTFELVAMHNERGAAIVLRDISRRERQEQAEREFFSNAAHELRTPLAAIGTAADALARGAKDIPAERDFYIDGILAEVERLSRLAEALLLLSRAQSNPDSLRSSRLELEPIVTDVAARLEVRPGVRVSVDSDDCAILGERALIEGALTNLARNAARHTERGSIRFTCSSDGKRVAVSVSDTGVGMTPEVRDRATARFFRGGDRERDGFGLGLAIAEEMVSALGGELEIDSRAGDGTTVTMTFQAAA